MLQRLANLNAAAAPNAATRVGRLSLSQPMLFALLSLIILMWTPALLNDPDSLWHIRAGEWMIANGAVLDSDPFSFSRAGEPWTTHEWLTEVLMAATYGVAGWSGLMTAAAAAAAACVYILGRFAAQWLNGLSLLLALMMGLSLIGPHFLVRPHLFALPLLCLWTVGVVAARNEDRAPSLWLLPVMALWANMHGSFILGICLLGPFALEALIAAAPERRRETLISWSAFSFGAVLAAIATPHGVGGLIYPIKLILMPGITGINEWAPADFSTLSLLEITLIASIFALVRFKVGLSPIRLLLLLGFLHLTFSHQRHEMVLGVLGIVFLSEPLGTAIAERSGRIPESKAADRSRLSYVLAALIAVLAIGVRLAVPAPAINAQHLPKEALAAVPQELSALPVLNDYSVGGYLIWNGVRPFIDGRADMYGPEFLARYFAIMDRGRSDLESALVEYDIRWTLLRKGSAPAALMDAMPGWTLLHADDRFVVHARTDSL